MEACSSDFLGNRLSICLKTQENQENLHRDGRSQEFSYAFWLQVSRPASERWKSNYVSLTRVPLPGCW